MSARSSLCYYFAPALAPDAPAPGPNDVARLESEDVVVGVRCVRSGKRCGVAARFR